VSSAVVPDLAPLAAMVLQDPDGKPVRLGSLWEEGPKRVLVFVRHFG
jgi:hypothetical protein